jgi:hypothetical protein
MGLSEASFRGEETMDGELSPQLGVSVRCVTVW